LRTVRAVITNATEFGTPVIEMFRHKDPREEPSGRGHVPRTSARTGQICAQSGVSH